MKKVHKSNFIRANIRSFINIPWGPARSHKKIGPDQFGSFDVFWLQKDRKSWARSALKAYSTDRWYIKLCIGSYKYVFVV